MERTLCVFTFAKCACACVIIVKWKISRLVENDDMISIICDSLTMSLTIRTAFLNDITFFSFFFLFDHFFDFVCFLFHTDNENEKFSTFPPSSHGSLSSITTTSITSEDPKGGDQDPNDKGFDRRTSKGIIHQPIIQEEWWKTTLQVSIPFLIAGLGTIGAGIILGRVEVNKRNILIKV